MMLKQQWNLAQNPHWITRWDQEGSVTTISKQKKEQMSKHVRLLVMLRLDAQNSQLAEVLAADMQKMRTAAVWM
jgi:hypothetical protein